MQMSEYDPAGPLVDPEEFQDWAPLMSEHGQYEEGLCVCEGCVTDRYDEIAHEVADELAEEERTRGRLGAGPRSPRRRGTGTAITPCGPGRPSRTPAHRTARPRWLRRTTSWR